MKEELNWYKWPLFWFLMVVVTATYEIDLHYKNRELFKQYQLLVKQKEIMRENWLHKIKFHDRYDDGYIELAQAMLDPVGDPYFIINGKKFDTNPNSNLEYFLRERGFDINNLESVPNSVFNPSKYVDARQILKSDGNYKGTDLTEVSDYYKRFSQEDIQAYLIEELEKHTHNARLIINTTPTNPLESSIKWNIDNNTFGFDAVYRPKGGTGFLNQFEPQKRVDGIHMLVNQAAPCFNKWFTNYGTQNIVDKGSCSISSLTKIDTIMIEYITNSQSFVGIYAIAFSMSNIGVYYWDFDF